MKAKYLVLVLIFLLEGLVAGAQCRIDWLYYSDSVVDIGQYYHWAAFAYDSSGGFMPEGRWTSTDTNILNFATPDSAMCRPVPKARGFVTVTYALTGACAGVSQSFRVEVVNGTNGATITCATTSSQLSHTMSYDTSGTWSSSATSIATVRGGEVFGITTGTAIITHTFSNWLGTFTVYDSFQVRAASALRDHFADTTVCYGSTMNISSLDTLNWRLTNHSVASFIGDTTDVNSTRITFSDSGTTLVYYSKYRCTSFIDTFRIRVMPFPGRDSIGPVRSVAGLCFGDTITFRNFSRSTGGHWSLLGFSHSTIDSLSGLFTNRDHLNSLSIDFSGNDAFGCEIFGFDSVYNLNGIDTFSIFGLDTLRYANRLRYSSLVRSTNYIWRLSGLGYQALLEPSTSFNAETFLTGLWPGRFDLLRINTICHDTFRKSIVALRDTVTTYSMFFNARTMAIICDSIGLRNQFLPYPYRLTLLTKYGDGTTDVITIPGSNTLFTQLLSHLYSAAGNYTIKQILIDSTGVRIDSIVFFANVMPCNAMHLTFYKDSNANCRYDGTDRLSGFWKRIGVDSNGVRIDTIMATHACHYNFNAPSGSVITFRPLDTNWRFSCSSDSVLRYTVGSGFYRVIDSISVEVELSRTDCRVSSNFNVGRHAIMGTIFVSNSSDIVQDGMVVFKHMPGFYVARATGRPIVTDTTVSWRLDSLGGYTTHGMYIYLERIRSLPWLRVDSLIRNLISFTPIGIIDIDSSNNQNDRWDTVKSSWDPNVIIPTPAGRIFNDTRIEYFVEFENQGNDTAHNIFVMDTLDSHLDMSTLELVTSSATMHTERIRAGGINIMKFSFPNIKLLDSSYHDQCRGHFIYTIKPRPGLANFTPIKARVGIYFDDNEVVMTPEAENTIIIPGDTIHTARAGVFCAGEPLRFYSTYNSVANTHFQWYKNGTAVGGDSSVYIASTLISGDRVKCTMTSIVAQDTILTNTNEITATVFNRTGIDTIVGPNFVCDTNSITLTNATSSGTWQVITGRTRISSTGVVRGVTTGVDTAIYIVTSVCFSDTAKHAVTVYPIVTPSIRIAVSPSDSMCGGIAATFTPTITNGGTSPAYRWRVFGAVVDSSTSYTYMPALGDIVSCNLISSAQCAVPSIVTSNSIDMLIIPSVTPRIDVVAIPADSVTSIGQMVNYFASVSFGGSTTNYQWVVNGSPVAGATSNTYARRAYRTDSVWCTTVSDAACATITNARSNKFAVKVPSLSIVDMGGQSPTLSLYPNPNNGICTLESKDGAVYSGSYTIEIRNITGSLLYSANTTAYNGRISLQLNLQHMLAQGAYILKLVGGERAEHLPFIIHQ